MNLTQQPDRSTAPATGDFEARSLPVPDERRLSNGIVRRSLDRSDYGLVRLDVVCPTGAMDYPVSVANMYCRMTKEGSRNYDSARIGEILDFNGASVTASASNHNIIVSLTALRRNISKVLPVFFDVLCKPTMPEKELAAVKRQMISELKCNRETAVYCARGELRRLIGGPDHRYGMSESETGLESISPELLDTVRSMSINPGHMAAYIAGRTDSGLLAEIDSRLEAIGGLSEDNSIRINGFEPEKPGRRQVQVDGSLQNSVQMGIPAGIMHPTLPDYWALRLAVHALGGYFGSRLMQNIREDKGYTYGIYSSLNNFSEGTFAIIGCECDSSYTEGVLREVDYELRRFAEEPMGEDELHRMRLNLASKLAGMCDTPMKSQAQYVSQLINGQGTGYYDMFWQALSEVSPEQMSAAAAKYLRPEYLRTVVAGDFRK